MSFEIMTSEKLINDFIKPYNSIHLGQPCKRGCVFCFIRQLGPKVQKPLYCKNFISKENIHEFFEHIDFDKRISFSTDDVFDYPEIEIIIEKIYDELIKRKGKGNIELISTCGSFTRNQIRVLKKIKDKSTVRISLISFDSNFKNKIMKGGWTKEHTQMIKKLIKEKLCDSVAIWFFGSVDALRKEFEIFDSLIQDYKDETIALDLSYPSVTRYANSYTKQLMDEIDKNLDVAVRLFFDRYSNHRTVMPTLSTMIDLFKYLKTGNEKQKFLIDDFNIRIKSAMDYLKQENMKYTDTGFITTASCIRLAKKNFSNLNWIEAKQNYWGGNIVVCDLLTLEDIKDAIINNKKYKYYVISKGIFSESCQKKDVQGIGLADFMKENSFEILSF